MERVEIGAIARRRFPLRCRLNDRALAPLVECGYQLPRLTRRDHVADILVPAGQVAGEAYRFLGVPEAGRDAIGVPRLAVSRPRRRVLVPAIGLRGAGAIPAEHLEHEVDVKPLACLGPPIYDRARCIARVIDEDDKLAVDAQ